MSGVDDQLRAIRDADRGRPRKHVTVIGAGMAGLVAAYELAQLGHTVRIFEASAGPRGRAWTHRFPDGTSGEFGPMRIPEHHDYTHHYVKQCGLELRRFVTSHENLSCFYDIRGVQVRMRDAREVLYDKFDLSTQQRDDPAPPKMLARAVGDVVEGLTDAERASLRTGDLASDRLREIDRTTMGEFLRARCGEDAAELVGAATGLETMFDRTAMMLLRDALTATGNRFDEIVGGMDLLPTSLAKLIKGEIVLRAPVRGIQARSDGAVDLVVERDGKRSTERCEVVVCAIPYSVLHHLELDPPLEPAKMAAVRSLGYESSTKVLLHCRRRFWETEYGIAGGASQSDHVHRATYYPSDNAVPVTEPTPSRARFNTMYGGYENGEFTPGSPEISAGPGVLLAAYNWGQDGCRLGQLAPEERRDAVIRLVARIHPEIAEPGMVDDHASMFWDQYPWTLGSFAELLPGQQGSMHNDAVSPEGNLHFAGEHASLDTGWIQGAVSSALRAVGEIVGGD
ncbi:MAG: flavin monoamine oxidase family protein [Actinomycetota bacterium]